MDETGLADHQQDQPTLDRLRAGVIPRAHVQGWPAIDVGAVTVEAGPENWASFLLKTQGIDDALIQPYSGHASRQSLEIYSRIALADAQESYDQVIGRFPV